MEKIGQIFSQILHCVNWSLHKYLGRVVLSEQMTSSDAKDGNMIEFWMRLISLFKDNSNCFRATVENPKLVLVKTKNELLS